MPVRHEYPPPKTCRGTRFCFALPKLRRSYYQRLECEYLAACEARRAQLLAIDRTPGNTPHFQLFIRCAEGHRFWLGARHLHGRKHFCAACNSAADRKRWLTVCQQLARDRGGELLSMTYATARAPLRWRCSEGHIWAASLQNLRGKGSWCPTCATRLRAESRRTGDRQGRRRRLAVRP